MSPPRYPIPFPPANSTRVHSPQIPHGNFSHRRSVPTFHPRPIPNRDFLVIFLSASWGRRGKILVEGRRTLTVAFPKNGENFTLLSTCCAAIASCFSRNTSSDRNPPCELVPLQFSISLKEYFKDTPSIDVTIYFFNRFEEPFSLEKFFRYTYRKSAEIATRVTSSIKSHPDFLLFPRVRPDWILRRDTSFPIQVSYAARFKSAKISTDVTTSIESSAECLLFSWVYSGDGNFSSLQRRTISKYYIIELKWTSWGAQNAVAFSSTFSGSEFSSCNRNKIQNCHLCTPTTCEFQQFFRKSPKDNLLRK